MRASVTSAVGHFSPSSFNTRTAKSGTRQTRESSRIMNNQLIVGGHFVRLAAVDADLAQGLFLADFVDLVG